MLYKKASEMKPTPIPHCMGGEGTVMMERLLDAPAEMLGKGRAYVRHTLAPGVTIGRHTHEHEMESMVIVSGRAVHIINGEEQILEKGDIIAAMRHPPDRLPGRRAAGADRTGAVRIKEEL